MSFITLLSDFGLQDPSVAVVKGTLMAYTTASLIDISHDIKPFNISQAAYLLSASFKNFPAGTCHILLFDLFSNATPRLLLSSHNGHYFLSPDNGLLPMALGALPQSTWLCYELTGSANSFIDWLHAAGNIIHQLKTKNANELALPEYTLLNTNPSNQDPSLAETQYDILHIDHYENVVVNITRPQFQNLVKDRPFQVKFMHVEEISEISDSYNSVREGYKLCRFNSNNYLEICINRGKAASLFGLRLGSKNNNIKIAIE